MKIGIVSFLFFASVLGLFGQTSQGSVEFSMDETQELVHVSFNESFLLSGEYFYYKFYCLNANKRTNSTLSQIGYLELIAKDGTSVFKHKIKLKNGLGYGDFFVPTSVQSGNYKLIGYTNWMKNWGQDIFFQEDIMVINPYNSNQKALVNNNSGNQLEELSQNTRVNPVPKTQIASPFNLVLNKKVFGKREPAELRMKKSGNRKIRGNFSISVRNANSYVEHGTGKENNASFWNKYKNANSESRIKTNVLPELRGELISGTVLDRESGEPLKNVKVLITFPGTEYDIRIVNTNAEGKFFANLDDRSQSNRVFIQLEDEPLEPYRIILDGDEKAIDQEKLDFGMYALSEKASEIIRSKSVQNQIENAYFSVKPDTLLLPSTELPFYGSNGKKYVLDDYTRFPTLEETALEILDKAWLSKKDGDVTFALRSDNGETRAQEYGSLLVVDGIPVLNQKTFIQNYEAYKIESITIVSDQYRIGSSIYDGLVDIQTKKQDYLNTRLDSQEGFSFLRPVINKNYFKQSYTSQNQNLRIPDQRNQLLWLPSVDFNGEEMIIDFYTSDVTGEFKVSLEGFSDTGEFIQLEETISVK